MHTHAVRARTQQVDRRNLVCLKIWGRALQPKHDVCYQRMFFHFQFSHSITKL